MTSDTESRAMVPYNTTSSRRDTGGNRNDGRTARDQGGRNGNSHAGNGGFRLLGRRNAGNRPRDPRGHNTSRGPGAAESRVQSWVHETSRHHNAENSRADSGSRNAGGTHDNSRTARNQGDRVTGDPHDGHGNSRRQEGRDATTQTRADSPASDTSSGPNATRRQTPAWVHDLVFNPQQRERERVVMARIDALARASRRN